MSPGWNTAEDNQRLVPKLRRELIRDTYRAAVGIVAVGKRLVQVLRGPERVGHRAATGNLDAYLSSSSSGDTLTYSSLGLARLVL